MFIAWPFDFLKKKKSEQCLLGDLGINHGNTYFFCEFNN